MKEALKFFEGPYYTAVASNLLAVIGLIISFWKNNRHRKLKPLIVFFLGYVLDQLILALGLGINFKSHLGYYIYYYTDSFDTIIEFLAFFFLIKNYVLSVKIKKHLDLLVPAFISSILIFFLYHKLIIHSEINQFFLQTIFTIQAFFLIVACVFYFIDLFRKEPKLNLNEQPSFWAITGLAFFMLCTFPFSIWGLYLVKTNRELYGQLYGIFNIFYCILFLMIIKAYFCKPEIAKKY